MNTDTALDNARKASSLIRQAANMLAYDTEQSHLTNTLYDLADKLEPVVEQGTAEIIPFPKSQDELPPQ